MQYGNYVAILHCFPDITAFAAVKPVFHTPPVFHQKNGYDAMAMSVPSLVLE